LYEERLRFEMGGGDHWMIGKNKINKWMGKRKMRKRKKTDDSLLLLGYLNNPQQMTT